MILNCLLSGYPENALELFRTLDYWECKELLDINSSSKSSPTERLQELENDKLNNLLDKKAYNKVKWMYLEDKKYSFKNIYEKSKTLMDSQ